MVKLKPEAIGPEHLARFLTEESDFAFELEVVRHLLSIDASVSHAGTYIDPHTEKPRQFDIQATIHLEQVDLCIALECKNVRPNFPLLVLRTPNTESNCHFSFWTRQTEVGSGDPTFVEGTPDYLQVGRATLVHDGSPYKPGEFSGRSLAQVGIDQTGMISATDSGFYDKWAQALGSACDLATRAFARMDDEHEYSIAASLIIPCVVVPDGMLWTVDLPDAHPAPVQADHTAFQVGFSTKLENGWTYSFSHVHFFTLSGLKRALAAPREHQPFMAIFSSGALEFQLQRLEALMV